MFDSRFETYLADTEFAHRLHYQIRYHVFCLDKGFEDPGKSLSQEETDRWDEQSVHFLIREKATGQWVATMRMILPKAKPFPIESICNVSFPDEFTYKRDASCEISRLSMVKRYRGHQGDAGISRSMGSAPDPTDVVTEVNDGVSRRSEPEIMLGLFRAALAYSRNHGLRQWYFLITPALARMIRKLGVLLEQMGPSVEHRGTRVPYVTDPEESCRTAFGKSHQIAEMFNRNVPAYRLFSELSPEQKVA